MYKKLLWLLLITILSGCSSHRLGNIQLKPSESIITHRQTILLSTKTDNINLKQISNKIFNKHGISMVDSGQASARAELSFRWIENYRYPISSTIQLFSLLTLPSNWESYYEVKAVVTPDGKTYETFSYVGSISSWTSIYTPLGLLMPGTHRTVYDDEDPVELKLMVMEYALHNIAFDIRAKFFGENFQNENI